MDPNYVQEYSNSSLSSRSQMNANRWIRKQSSSFGRGTRQTVQQALGQLDLYLNSAPSLVTPSNAQHY